MSRDITGELKTALETHAKQVQTRGLNELRPYPVGILITYGDLCSLADNPVIPRGAGKYLTELAPLDALVVARRTGLPGSKFNSGAFNRAEWENQAKSALAALLAKA